MAAALRRSERLTPKHMKHTCLAEPTSTTRVCGETQARQKRLSRKLSPRTRTTHPPMRVSPSYTYARAAQAVGHSRLTDVRHCFFRGADGPKRHLPWTIRSQMRTTRLR